MKLEQMCALRGEGWGVKAKSVHLVFMMSFYCLQKAYKVGGGV